MEFEAVIGLEVHAQMQTESKIFSAASAAYGGEPNSKTDPVILGMPGVLPVLNRRVVEFAIKMGLATHCKIARRNRFARKHYFYPDLPKGYQISQYELPICSDGYVDIELEDGSNKRIGLTRIHMEEDAGKSIHDFPGAGKNSLVDLNRSGVPLIEIVSEPDIRSAEEAYAYLARLKQLLTYLEICDGNMEEGSLRCDANVSIRPVGAKEFGIKTEVKNMNSFRNVERAINFEIERQKRKVAAGETIVQETLLWDANAGTARSMRSKEDAHDYRYFPEPDLVPLDISDTWIGEITDSMPELPLAKRDRFMNSYSLPPYDAGVLTANKALADYYEKAAAGCKDHKLLSNLVMSEVLRVLKEQKIEIEQFMIHAADLAELVNLVDGGNISLKIAKTVFEDMLDSEESAAAIVDRKGLGQISDENVLVELVEKVIADSPGQVTQYLDGKDKLMGFFVGQIMKATGGKANPAMVNKLFKEKLKVKG